MEHHEAVSETCGPLQVVQRRYNSSARLGESVDVVEKIQPMADIEMRRRLVEQQDRRILSKGLGEKHALLFSTRERRYRPVRQVPEAEGIDGLGHEPPIDWTEGCQPSNMGRAAHRDDLPDAERERQIGVLPNQRDLSCSVSPGPPTEFSASETKGPRVWQEPSHCAEQRAFACPVRPDDSDPLALANVQREVAQNGASVECDGEVGCRDDGGRHGDGKRTVATYRPDQPAVIRLASVLALLTFVSCDAVSIGEAQRQFELDAISTPSGYTQTDAQGRVISRDVDDWRPSPLYQSSFNLTFVPYPNPASATQNVQFAATFSGGGNGLVPYRLDSRGDLVLIQGVTGTTDGSAPLFSFPAGQLGATGLHRVVLTDPLGRFVTYGDIQVIP